LKHWFHFILYGVAPNVALESNCKWKPLSWCRNISFFFIRGYEYDAMSNRCIGYD
jgi:hypothetical protein